MWRKWSSGSSLNSKVAIHAVSVQTEYEMKRGTAYNSVKKDQWACYFQMGNGISDVTVPAEVKVKYSPTFRVRESAS